MNPDVCFPNEVVLVKMPAMTESHGTFCGSYT